MQELWQKFRRGDSLTDAELSALIKQAEAAVPYLQARLPEYHLAYKETSTDLVRLQEFQDARRKQKKTG